MRLRLRLCSTAVRISGDQWKVLGDYSGLILGAEVASSARDGERDIEISCAYELGRFAGHDSRTHGPTNLSA